METAILHRKLFLGYLSYAGSLGFVKTSKGNEELNALDVVQNELKAVREYY